jgi:hypothetical protein
MSILQNPNRLNKAAITKEFSQRLISRLVAKLDGEGDFLSSFDLRAMQELRDCHPQDTGDVDLERIALEEFFLLNPSYKLKDDEKLTGNDLLAEQVRAAHYRGEI